MRRAARVLLIILLSLVLIVAIALTVISTFNWNHARPWVGRQLTEMTHRPVTLQGDLSVQWERRSEESGWKGRIPWPQLSAEQVTVGQPEWMNVEGDMARAGRITLLLNPLPLAARVVQLVNLRLENAQIALARREDGVSNWTLTETPPEKKNEPSRWKVDLQRLELEKVNIGITDPSLKLDLNADLDTLAETTEEGYGLGWQASGTYNEASVSGKGRSGGVLTLHPENSQPFPIEGGIEVGKTVIQVAGSVTRPASLTALDVQLQLKGASMSDLNPLFGIALPNTPAYSTEGRLIAKLEGEQDVWRYEQFQGRVGESDLHGTLQYEKREPRSFLSGEVESELLRIQDLGPIIGLDDREDEGKKEGAKQPANKALPVDDINTASWGVMDANVKVKGHRIDRDEDLPLEDIEAHVVLDNKVLTLEPLNFGIAGGNLTSNIYLDGREDDIKAKMNVSARGLQIRKLVPKAESMKASLGMIHGDASVAGHGKSFAQMLATADGEVKAVATKGTISRFLLEAAGLNIANMVIVQLFGDEQVLMNCLAADFGVKNGVMHTRAFLLDTEDAVVEVTGNISLRKEALDLDVKPENKSLRIFTLRTPLYVRGTFKNPDVGVHKGPIAARAGAAVALGVIATPLAAVIPLLNLGTEDESECGPLLKAATKKPDAPPPGGEEKAKQPSKQSGAKK